MTSSSSLLSLLLLLLLSSLVAVAAAVPTDSLPPLHGAARVQELAQVPSRAARDDDVVELAVISRHKHNPESFTQGLVVHRGHLVESAGVWGQSTVKFANITSGVETRGVSLPAAQFGEGIAVFNDSLLYQLTYQGGDVHVYNASTLERKRVLQLPRADVDDQRVDAVPEEGWGLAANASCLFVSDGSSTIFVVSPDDMRVLDRIHVTYNGERVNKLNELEWVNGTLYANIYASNCLVAIDAATGVIRRWFVASKLFAENEFPDVDVFNGIAYDTREHAFYVTGKRWPTMFRVDVLGSSKKADIRECQPHALTVKGMMHTTQLLHPNNPFAPRDGRGNGAEQPRLFSGRPLIRAVDEQLVPPML